MALVYELVPGEGVKEFVVEGLVQGLVGEHCAEVRAALTHDRSKRRMEARSGAIAMCLDAAENPMMYVLWWVNIGWLLAMRSSSSG